MQKSDVLAIDDFQLFSGSSPRVEKPGLVRLRIGAAVAREKGLSRPRRGSKLMDERWLTGAGSQLGEAIADSRILARVRVGIYMCAAGRDLVPSRFLSMTTRTMGAWLTGWRASIA